MADPPKNEALLDKEDIETRRKKLQEVFDAFDKAGLPEDFLSPAERSQEPPQERPGLLEWEPKTGDREAKS